MVGLTYMRSATELQGGYFMLSLRFSTDDYAFVYTEGRPIGAILVGETKGRGQFSLLFSGRETDFEILRPQAIERRFGRQELEKLRSRFLRFGPRNTSRRAVRVAAD
jgi:hypothetical protein